MNSIVKLVEKIIIKEDEELFNNHISLVTDYCISLAKHESLDEELLALCCLLHDIGKIRFKNKDHNITGALEARKILEEQYYDKERIDIICEAILVHSSNSSCPKDCFYGEVLRCADGLAHLDMVFLFVVAQYKKSNHSLSCALKKVLDKINFEWENKITLPFAKQIGEEKYFCAKFLLENSLEQLNKDKK